MENKKGKYFGKKYIIRSFEIASYIILSLFIYLMTALATAAIFKALTIKSEVTFHLTIISFLLLAFLILKKKDRIYLVRVKKIIRPILIGLVFVLSLFFIHMVYIQGFTSEVGGGDMFNQKIKEALKNSKEQDIEMNHIDFGYEWDEICFPSFSDYSSVHSNELNTFLKYKNNEDHIFYLPESTFMILMINSGKEDYKIFAVHDNFHSDERLKYYYTKDKILSDACFKNSDKLIIRQATSDNNKRAIELNIKIK